jgi:hypothetical protein
VPAEILGANFVRSLTIDDLRQWFPVMYELPGEYKIAAQLKGARFFVTEVDSNGVLQAVANHRSNWFGIIDAKVGLDAKPQLSILILPVSGGRLKIRLEKEDGQTTQPLIGAPVKAFAGSITEDPANVWEATDIEPVLTGTSGISGEVKWECNKCLPQGTYTILAKQQDKYQTLEVTESDSGWGEKCSGLIEQTVAFVETQPPLSIQGDLDGDGDVDMDDRVIFLSSFRKCSGDTGFLSDADYDGDGCITLNDYREWYKRYTIFANQ